MFDDFVAQANVDMERSILRGPADDNEVENMVALGRNPEAVIQVAEARAAQERDLTLRLNGEERWRRGWLRDVVSMCELEIEFQNILAERGLVLRDVISGQESARAFVRAMPSTEVSIELKTAWHRNGDKVWTANDIYDIDAMSLAVPYCDVVLPDKAFYHVLNSAGLGERMHTALLRNLVDLPTTLDRWKPKRGLTN